MNRAIAFNEIILGEVGLAGHAVQAAVCIKFNIAVVVAGLKKFLHAHTVALFRGANEVIVTDIQFPPGFSEEGSDGIGKSLGRQASGVGGLLNLQTVFICASEKVHIVADEAVPACQSVTDNCGVRMT